MTKLPEKITLFSCYGCEEVSVAKDLKRDGNHLRCPRCGTIVGKGAFEKYERAEQ